MYSDALLQKILTTSSALKPQEIKELVATAKEKHVRLEEAVLAKMPEETLYHVVAEYFKVPFVDLKGVQVRKDFLDLVPEPIATTHDIVPFDKGETLLKVAELGPEDLQTIEFLKHKTGLEVQVHVTTPFALREIIKQYKRSLKAEFEDIAKVTATPGEEVDQQKLRELAQDLPVVRIVESLLEHAVFEGAAVLGRIAREKITVFPGPPAIFQSLLALPDLSKYDISSFCTWA